MPTPLTAHEKRVLEFAQKNYHHEADRERAVWQALELNLTEFWQAVNALIDSEAALAHAPLLINRLRRIRDQRRRVRVSPVAYFEDGWRAGHSE